MSVPAFAWAIEMGRVHRLCPDDRCLLMVLANMADKHLECFPLQSTLMADTGLPKRTLIRSTRRLEVAGLVRTEPRGRSLTYHIQRPTNGATVAPDRSGNGAALAPDNPLKGATQAPFSARKGATVAPVEPTNGATQAPVMENRVNGATVAPVIPTTGAKSANEWCHGGTSPYININQEKINQEREERKNPPQTPPVPGGAERVPPQDRHAYPSDFEAFWLAYPRQAGKRAALKAWHGATVRAGSPAPIMAGLAAHRFCAEERFIPHPSTWLNRDQWLDVQDSFDPVLRAVGLTPEDLADWPMPSRRLLQ